MPVIWNLNEWADAVLELPVEGACPTRTVLVPNQRVAHALRRALLQHNQPHVLAGTRFIHLLHLAQDFLTGAPTESVPNDRTLGPLLIREVFHSVSLARFKTTDLLALRGWDEAFSSTLAELEAALLTPEDLLHHTDPQVADVGRIFAAVRDHGAWVSAAFVRDVIDNIAGALRKLTDSRASHAFERRSCSHTAPYIAMSARRKR